MPETAAAPAKEKSPYSHEISLPSGTLAKIKLTHENITVTRRLNTRDRALIERLVNNELNGTNAPDGLREKITERLHKAASTHTLRGTNLSIVFIKGKKEGVLKGYSVCKPPDNFCRVEGIKHALKNIYVQEPDAFSEEDRTTILIALCPSLKEEIEKSKNLAEQRANQRKKGKGKVSGQRVIHADKLTPQPKVKKPLPPPVEPSQMVVLAEQDPRNKKR